MSKFTKTVLAPVQQSATKKLTLNSRPYDVKKLRVSLKQWRILHAVIDCGGFAEAALCLHLSQSAISYTVAKLQQQLGTPLLKTVGRKAILTETGQLLLDKSRHLLKGAIELEKFAESLGAGCIQEINLVVDHDLPSHLLMRALRQFALSSHGTSVLLTEVTSREAEISLRNRTTGLAISKQVPLGFLGDRLMEVEYIAVAHPEHPLFKLQREISADDLSHQVQIMVRKMKDSEQNRVGLPNNEPCWDVGSVDTAIEAVCECLGYAWLPRHRIVKWLDQAILKPLPLREGGSHKTTLYLIFGRPWAPSHGVSHLAEILRVLATEVMETQDKYFTL
jgi:DNA-binding transcriptional LysR family regulator